MFLHVEKKKKESKKAFVFLSCVFVEWKLEIVSHYYISFFPCSSPSFEIFKNLKLYLPFPGL